MKEKMEVRPYCKVVFLYKSCTRQKVPQGPTKHKEWKRQSCTHLTHAYTLTHTAWLQRGEIFVWPTKHPCIACQLHKRFIMLFVTLWKSVGLLIDCALIVVSCIIFVWSTWAPRALTFPMCVNTLILTRVGSCWVKITTTRTFSAQVDRE